MRGIRTKKTFYLAYVALFCLIAGFICLYFIVSGSTFVWYGDGRLQHLRALIYYHDYIREILENIFVNHTFVIPRWDFSIGEGADILETFCYYVIGDPFSFLAFLCPTAYMHIYYAIAILARMFVSGVAFSELCFYVKKKEDESSYYMGVLAGSISYVFCYWMLINVLRHPFFMNPMIYLPLLILGVEKVIREKKYKCLTLSTLIAALSNFYFLYMLAIFTGLYLIIRLVLNFRDTKKIEWGWLGKCLGAAFVGVLMSAVILLPTLHTVMNDARISESTTWHLLYPLLYYSRLPGSLISAGSTYAMYMGFAAPVVLALFVLIFKKGYRLLKTSAVICIVIMLFPFFGQILNGFSYMSNRWCWCFALVACMTLVYMWDGLMELTAKDAIRLFVGLAVYAAVCLLFEYSRIARVFEGIMLALFALVILMPLAGEAGKVLRIDKVLKQWLVTGIIVISVMLTFFNKYAVSASNYIADSTSADYAQNIKKNETTAIKRRAKADGVDDFYRYSGSGMSLNGNVTSGLSGANYYWTLSNPYVAEFRSAVNLPDANGFNYNGYDDRSILMDLSGVKYYASTKYYAPYGFDNLTKHKVTGVSFLSSNVEETKYRVWENQNDLGIASVYDSYISREEWDDLSFLEKQEALLYGVVVEDDSKLTGVGETAADDIDFSSQEISYSVLEKDDDLVISDNSFVATAEGASVTFEVDGQPGEECYISFKGLLLTPKTTYDLYTEDEADPDDLYDEEGLDAISYSQKQANLRGDAFYEKIEYSYIDIKARSSGCYDEDLTENDAYDYLAMTTNKSLQVFTEDYNHYNGPGDYAIDLRYTEDGTATVTLKFNTVGIYSFDSFGFYSQAMDNYDEQIEKLKANSPESTEVETDRVTVKIDADSDKLVLLSIPYSTGWKAYVDGEEVDLLRADVMYMAVEVTAGEHEIVLEYSNPYIMWGFVVSLAGLLIFAIICFKQGKKNYK